MRKFDGYSVAERKEIARTSRNYETLEILSSDRNCDVRDGVVENPNCPGEILEKLASDEAVFIRCIVAGHPNISRAAIIKLLKDTHPAVKANLEHNPNIPEDLKKFI